jgi:carboxymethylenebutenolidase
MKVHLGFSLSDRIILVGAVLASILSLSFMPLGGNVLTGAFAQNATEEQRSATSSIAAVGAIANARDDENGNPVWVLSGSDSSMPSDRPANATATELKGLTTSTVNYYGNASGYLVYPKNGSSLPAVVMIHEWWGLNQNIKNMAEQLAREGYVVLAVDLYGGEVAAEANRARELSSAVGSNPQVAIENMQAAVQHLSSLQNVNSSRIASLGWCFGGGQSLQLALNTEQPLATTVIYYGNLVTDQNELSKIDWPVLGIFGSADQSIPVDTVRQFKSALDADRIENEIHIYEGVGHAFANPSGDNYAPEETADAWAKTLDFLKRHV